jgi:hypothetical protein
LKKIHLTKSAFSDIGKTKQAGQVNKQYARTSQAGWVNFLALTANIFALASNRTNIHNNMLGTPP